LPETSHFAPDLLICKVGSSNASTAFLTCPVVTAIEQTRTTNDTRLPFTIAIKHLHFSFIINPDSTCAHEKTPPRSSTNHCRYE
jgi:hypothetical protein